MPPACRGWRRMQTVRLPFSPRPPWPNPAGFLVGSTSLLASPPRPCVARVRRRMDLQAGRPRAAPWIRRHRGLTIALAVRTGCCLPAGWARLSRHHPARPAHQASRRDLTALSCWGAPPCGPSQPQLLRLPGGLSAAPSCKRPPQVSAVHVVARAAYVPAAAWRNLALERGRVTIHQLRAAGAWDGDNSAWSWPCLLQRAPTSGSLAAILVAALGCGGLPLAWPWPARKPWLSALGRQGVTVSSGLEEDPLPCLQPPAGRVGPFAASTAFWPTDGLAGGCGRSQEDQPGVGARSVVVFSARWQSGWDARLAAEGGSSPAWCWTGR